MVTILFVTNPPDEQTGNLFHLNFSPDPRIEAIQKQNHIEMDRLLPWRDATLLQSTTEAASLQFILHPKGSHETD